MTYKIANKCIEIKSVCNDIHQYCKDYACDEKADLIVETTRADIEAEHERFLTSNGIENIKSNRLPDGYIETIAVYRKICEKMPEFDTMLFHGSVVAVDGEGYMFIATSGTGKSTHTRLWREYFKDRAVMINDDKPLVRVSKDEVTVFGTPWDGKHRLSTNTSVPLKAICILERAEVNKIEKMDRLDAYHMLLQQCFHPKSQENMIRTLDMLDTVLDKVGLYKLGCNMDIEAAQVSYNGMQ